MANTIAYCTVVLITIFTVSIITLGITSLSQMTHIKMTFCTLRLGDKHNSLLHCGINIHYGTPTLSINITTLSITSLCLKTPSMTAFNILTYSKTIFYNLANFHDQNHYC